MILGIISALLYFAGIVILILGGEELSKTLRIFGFTLLVVSTLIAIPLIIIAYY